ncbi:hypothetical protein [Nocardia sp. XZ_19_385]|uniref:hypothetical protein n=1 Tax=Nocardia sp. XZ_19_385 TaxID=2769488 RepID=UPI00188E771C|nr:hypothetical protein [Nocardia sp. XZ_19_385]
MYFRVWDAVSGAVLFLAVAVFAALAPDVVADVVPEGGGYAITAGIGMLGSLVALLLGFWQLLLAALDQRTLWWRPLIGLAALVACYVFGELVRQLVPAFG